jgi:hypothetical protein
VERRLHRIAAGLAVLAPLAAALTGCGPPTRGLIGVSATEEGPIAVVWTCDDQPQLTVRVYYGPTDTDFFELTGSVRKREMVRVPLTAASPNWQETGTWADLQAGVTIEADLEYGPHHYRLGSLVRFRPDRLPVSPLIAVDGVGDEGDLFTVRTPPGFLRATECQI